MSNNQSKAKNLKTNAAPEVSFSQSEDHARLIRKRPPFTQLENAIPEDEQVSKHALMVYWVLCKHANRDGEDSFPSLNTIAQESRSGRTTVVKAVKELIKLGYIKKECRKREDNPKVCTSNLYTILTQYKYEKAHSPSQDHPSPSQDHPSPNEVREQYPSNDITNNEKEARHYHGDKVLLTNTEYQRLNDEFTEEVTNRYMEKVNDYCVQHGKHYADYNRTIRNWIRSDKEKGTFIESAKKQEYKLNTCPDCGKSVPAGSCRCGWFLRPEGESVAAASV